MTRSPMHLVHSAMYWYRAEQRLGKFSVVGTTIKCPTQVPVNLVADEKHSWLLGKRVYLTTTVADECFLGGEVVKSASSPFGELNGFVYHENWLHHLLIAGSMNGYVPRDEKLNRIS